MNVGFIGLGNMGGPMTRNLLKAGHRVVCFDLVPALVEQCVAAGAEPGATADKTVQGVDVLISMLPASHHVRGLYLDQGLLERIDPATTVIDCSTISPAVASEVAAAASKRGIDMLDAPVSGGTAGAENATLTFIVGGPDTVIAKMRPLLADMGANIFHAGSSGAENRPITI